MNTATPPKNIYEDSPGVPWVYCLTYALWVIAIVVCLTGFVKACTEQRATQGSSYVR